ncbi:MAG: PilZ domain-containing protein [Candidatus Scalindua sp.]|nr:PilZ domain-containing protein [Candidatus Scalindua sp.]
MNDLDQMNDPSEKREFKRIEKPFMARFRVKQYKGLEMSSFYWDMVSVKNVSAGGMLFYYNRNLGFESLLELKINISHTTPTINCLGKVIRIEEPEPHSLFRIATSFTDIGKKEKEIINKTALECI